MPSATKASKPVDGLEAGDMVYARHPDRGVAIVRVLAVGRDGFQGDDETGARVKVRHSEYLGHKTRLLHTYSLVDEGADGVLVERGDGQRRFLRGELPKEQENSGGEDRPGSDSDPLLSGLDDLLGKALRPLPEPAAWLIKAVAHTARGRPGLVQRRITDRKGRTANRWVRANKDEAKHKPPAHKHGDAVRFRHGDVEGKGEIVGSGQDGVTVRDHTGREHMVRHDALLEPDAEDKQERKDKAEAKDQPQAPIPANSFRAIDVYRQEDDPEITPEKVLSAFPPDTKQKLEAVEAKIAEAGEDTKTQHTGANGEYTPERQALHQKIFDHFITPELLNAARPADGQKPTFTILGGRGGSGKSWFKGQVYDPAKAVVLDADEIKGMLPEYEGWNAALVHEESGDIFDAITDMAQDLGLNIVHDATMKTAAKAVALVERFNDAGYRTEAHYMFAPRQMAANRAVSRFLSAGRYVPPEVVLANTSNEKSFDAVKGLVSRWSFRHNGTVGQTLPKLLSEGGNDETDTGSTGLHGQPAGSGKGQDAAKRSAGKSTGGRQGGGSPEGRHEAVYDVAKAFAPGEEAIPLRPLLILPNDGRRA